MVAPQEEEVVGVLYLVGHQQADTLQRLLPPVHIVAQKQIVPLVRCAKQLKDSQEVLELAVSVPANLDGRFELKQHGLLHENIFGDCSQSLDFVLSEGERFLIEGGFC